MTRAELRHRLAVPLAAWRGQWAHLAPRERRLVAFAAVLVAAAFIWLVLVAPAWRMLRDAPARQRAADLALDRMAQQAATAATLKEGAAAGRGVVALDALRRLTADQFGTTGQFEGAADTATVTLRQADAGRLGRWLAAVQAATHARPMRLALRRDAAPASTWSGQITLQLPPPSP